MNNDLKFRSFIVGESEDGLFRRLFRRLRSPIQKFITISIGSLFLVSAAVHADPIQLPPGIDFSILPPPPGDDSPAGLADLNVLLYVQANRTEDQVKFAEKMSSPSVFEMGREIFGPWFTRENLPKTAEFLREMTQATNSVKEDAKNHWKRPRPYMRSELISPVVKKPKDGGCYPSGHTYGIAVSEYVLAAAFPEQTQRFEEMIRRVMWGRIVGGVHFPSDTEAGRLLAKDVVEKMSASEEFKQRIEMIRNEVKPYLIAK